VRAARPFATPPVTTQTAEEALETVLESAGAILPARDAIDLRIVTDVRHGTGAVINFESDVPEPGRWQVYHSLPAPADHDGDGIPDYWEQQFGLDPGSPADAMRIAAGGYANLEHYLNNTDPRGGSLPIVYIAAAVSRAWRDSHQPGMFRLYRTGPVNASLAVELHSGTVTIPAGAAWTDIPVAPGAQDLVVGEIEPGRGYHIGCPKAALVAVGNGPPPRPVDIRLVDPDGGVSAEVRAQGEANMRQHKLDKPAKLQRRDQK